MKRRSIAGHVSSLYLLHFQDLDRGGSNKYMFERQVSLKDCEGYSRVLFTGITFSRVLLPNFTTRWSNSLFNVAFSTRNIIDKVVHVHEIVPICVGNPVWHLKS